MRIISPTIIETFDCAVQKDGVGVTGLSIKIYIQRVSDSKWWKHATLDWDAAVTQNAMTEVDATNLKGLYQYLSLPVAKMADGDRYRVRYYGADVGYEVDKSEVIGVESSDTEIGDLGTKLDTLLAGVNAIQFNGHTIIERGDGLLSNEVPNNVSNSFTVKYDHPALFSYNRTLNGVGLTGKSMWCTLQRLSDNKYFNWDTSDWYALIYNPESLYQMDEVDAAGSPGLYKDTLYGATWGQLEAMSAVKETFVVHVYELSDAVVVWEDYVRCFVEKNFADMALDSTVAKDATVSKPGTAQTITAPADMALNSTVAKETDATDNVGRLVLNQREIIKSIKTSKGNLII